MSQALEYIQSRLNPKQGSLTLLMKYADFSQAGLFFVNIYRLFGNIRIELTLPGQSFNFGEILTSDSAFDNENMPYTQEATRNILIRSFEDRLKYEHFCGEAGFSCYHSGIPITTRRILFMLGNFAYSNPTRLYFGENSLDFLKQELSNYGPNVMLTYGGGSIKKSGLYDEIIKLLKESGKNITELPDVMSNPTHTKLLEGANLARQNSIDLILAVGGGSVCDYSKAVSVSAYYDGDPWEHYFLKMQEPTCKIIPVGCVLTMVGTGSEMNGGSVITNHDQKLKIGHVFGDNVFPKFSILNPVYTYTIPQYQMVAGFYDIMCHILEQYLSGNDDNTSDYIAEGLMKSLVHSSRIAVKNPKDYEARSNIMWTATWALNTLIAKGKATDWMVHMIGQSVGAYTNATHGMTLSAVSLAYYRHILDAGVMRFARFAVNVWGVSPEGKTEHQLAEESLKCLEAWMREIGVVMNLRELGVTEDMYDGIADGTFILTGGYKTLTREEVIEILKESM